MADLLIIATCSCCKIRPAPPGFRACTHCRGVKRAKRDKAKTGALVADDRYVDPWLAVCERCPLEDCVRPEGAYGEWGVRNYAADNPIWLCPKTRAEERGWGAARAIREAGSLGLLEPVKWGEL